jgi:CubicO group peptidase (beta-lactamase class C family)
MSVVTELPAALRRGIRRHKVPGASVALLRNGRVTTASAGVLNLDTGVKTTPESVFQIGSISKVFTATLIMQLVDEGRIDLDQPLSEYLRDFRTLDPASRTVTIRQLLCHTSGIEGDLFVDSGRGDEATARLQDMGRLLPSSFAPGERLSYCNFGFAMLGRVLEVSTGKSFDSLLQKRIFEPLQMNHALSRPEDSIRFANAIGHVPDPRNSLAAIVSPTPWLGLGMKAAGSTPSMSAENLLRFVSMHLSRGVSPDGERLLTRSSVREMQRRQHQLPANTRVGVSGWGLGWFLDTWSGVKMIGHDGATVGQYAFLRVLPAKKLALVLLTNGGDAISLYEDIFRDVFRATAKVDLPQLPAPPKRLPKDLERLCGRYENLTGAIEITGSKQLRVEITPKPGFLAGMQLTRTPAIALTKNLLKLDADTPQLARTTLSFEGDVANQPQFVSMGMRLYKRC